MVFSKPLPVSDSAPKLVGTTLKATIATVRPDNASEAGKARAIGVAVVIRGDKGAVGIRWSGYTISEDMARAAVIAYILKYVLEPHQHLDVYCLGLDILQYVPAARRRGGTTSDKGKPFKAFSLFDPVEDAAGKSWTHNGFKKGEEPDDLKDAQREARAARDEAVRLVPQFGTSRIDHPDWWFLTGYIIEDPEVVAIGSL